MTDRVQNFNSHAHVERDMKVLIACEESQISTHTLTWSVTVKWLNTIFVNAISTHTLTWSVTLCGILQGKECKISTHTLTWSVTSQMRCIRKW